MSTSEKISVMQAFEDGKTIEYRISGRDCWTEAKEPCWNWAYCEYRVKPEVFYLNMFGRGDPLAYHEKATALEFSPKVEGYEVAVPFVRLTSEVAKLLGIEL